MDANRDRTLQPSEIEQTTYSCAAVNRKRIVFATAATFTGALGGIAGADAKCMVAAAAVPALVGKTFRAWISDASSSPASSFKTDGSFVTVGGAVIADTLNDMREGSITALITTEAGAVPSVGVWTGTTETGFNITGDDCSGWTDEGVGTLGTQGNTSVTQFYWSAYFTGIASDSVTCDSKAALYCFED